MLVKMTVQISGTRNGEDWPAPGGTIDISEDEAAMLFRTRQAIPAEDEMPEGSRFLGTAEAEGSKQLADHEVAEAIERARAAEDAAAVEAAAASEAKEAAEAAAAVEAAAASEAKEAAEAAAADTKKPRGRRADA